MGPFRKIRMIVALFDTHVFLLNEYFIELNTANFNIQLLEYTIPTPAPAAAAVSPKSPRCYGVSHVMVLAMLWCKPCYVVSHVMVLAMLWC